MKPTALYTDGDSRELYFDGLRAHKREVAKGATFAHFAALKIAVWCDTDAVMADAAELMAHELRGYVGRLQDYPEELLAVEWLIDPGILKRSTTLRTEVDRALSFNRAFTDARLQGESTAVVPIYDAPVGIELEEVYDQLLVDLAHLHWLDQDDRHVALRRFHSALRAIGLEVGE